MRVVTSTHPPAEALLLQKAGRLLGTGRDRCQPWGCSGCRQRRGLVEPRCAALGFWEPISALMAWIIGL